MDRSLDRGGVRRLLAVVLMALLTLALSGVGVPVAHAVVPSETMLNVPMHRWSWHTWSTEAGLPQISGKALAIDHEGLVWIGTENGLARFDGFRFDVFTPGTTPELAASWITRLLVDREGRVWIGNLRNLTVYVDGRFLGSEELGEVSALAQADDGSVLVGGERLYRARVKGGRLLVHRHGADAGAVTALHAVAGEGIWIAERDGRVSHHLDGRDTRIQTPDYLTRVTVMTWAADQLWLGGDAGLFRQDGTALSPVAFAPDGEGDAVHALAAGPDGTLWIASQSNVYRRFADGRVETIDSLAPHGFSSTVALLPTSDGIWMGSQYHGLRHYWLPVVQRLGREDGLHNTTVWSFAVDGDALLVGTDDGVAVWDGQRFRQRLAGDRLPHPAAYSLLRDRRGRVWVGTRAGLARFEPDLARSRVFDELRGAQVNGVIEHADGSVWIASAKGLFRHGDDDRLQLVNPNGLLSGIRIRALTWSDNGDMWIGTESGLFRLRGAQLEPVAGTGMDGVFVTSVRVLDDGRLVVGSYDRGIAVGTPDGGWRHDTEATGLPSDTVFNLQPVSGGVLASSSSGVYQWQLPDDDQAPARYRKLLRDLGDWPGRSRTRCCNGAGNDKGVLHLGAYWLPTLDGVVRVALDMPDPVPPVVQVVGVNGALPAATGVVLDAGARDLAVQVRAIDYRDGFRLRFRHRLHGLDSGWIETPSRDHIAYPQLPAGQFRFDVQAQQPFMPWGDTTSLVVDVPARFQETRAFRLLLLVALAILAFALVRWREGVLRKQKDTLEKLVAARTSELALANLRLGELNQVLNEASLSDPLTGLGNRRHLLQIIGSLQADVRAAWHAGATTPLLGVIVIDVDHFKHINDVLGHLAGDQVLCRIAQLLKRNVGATDGLARWGGEEFVVVTRVDGVEQLLEFAEHLRQVVEAEGIDVTSQHRVTASLGVAAWPNATATLDRHDWTVTLALADFALYRAKVSGRNRSALITVPGVPSAQWPDRPDAATIRRWLDQWQAELHLRP